MRCHFSSGSSSSCPSHLGAEAGCPKVVRDHRTPHYPPSSQTQPKPPFPRERSSCRPSNAVAAADPYQILVARLCPFRYTAKHGKVSPSPSLAQRSTSQPSLEGQLSCVPPFPNNVKPINPYTPYPHFTSKPPPASSPHQTPPSSPPSPPPLPHSPPISYPLTAHH